ncbi:hypothetical protein GOBAR_AA05791 [Gossypium barbadense]|uniref:Uncharacterized protein n=1 Tax=Gossypium barbadense TaxID=3634 RepID=A0A2P5YGQ2_GOSBA|nr:hypothetical protein GOBAR_AA05791 [Gossypium barbadense]
MHEQTYANTLMLTASVDIRIFGSTRTTQGTEDSSEESISLLREIDEYIDVRLYMQSARGGPYSMAADGVRMRAVQGRSFVKKEEEIGLGL